MTQTLSQRFQRLHPENVGIPSDVLLDIKNALHITLPKELENITKENDVNLFNEDLFNVNNVEEDEYGVIYRTLFYRKNASLPNRYLALSESEVGMRFLDSLDGKVLYISIPDVYNLCEKNTLLYKPTIFPSFKDFFEYLLTEEEKERGLIVPH